MILIVGEDNPSRRRDSVEDLSQCSGGAAARVT